MKQYKGYYIGEGCFNNEKEVDEFLVAQAIEAYKMAVKLFAERRTVENAIYCNEKAERLVNQFGFTWEQVEAIA